MRLVPDLVVLAGRPAMGKTSLATNIAFNIAKAYRSETRPDGTLGPDRNFFPVNDAC